MKPIHTMLAATLVLAGCDSLGLRQVQPGFTGLPADFDPGHFTCCFDPERWPEAFANASLAIAPWALELNPFDDAGIPGALVGKTEAIEHVVATARPLDLVLFANKTYIGGRFIPGRFTHSAIYLGTEAELRAIGLWNDPAFIPLHDDIRAGKIFLEAFRPVVELSTAEHMLATDAAAILRPQLSRAQRREAARRGVSRLGTPFDYWFDDRTPDTLGCTELLEYALPWIKFDKTVSYGRPAVMPDSVVAQAIRGEGLSFVASRSAGSRVVVTWLTASAGSWMTSRHSGGRPPAEPLAAPQGRTTLWQTRKRAGDVGTL